MPEGNTGPKVKLCPNGVRIKLSIFGDALGEFPEEIPFCDEVDARLDMGTQLPVIRTGDQKRIVRLPTHGLAAIEPAHNATIT